MSVSTVYDTQVAEHAYSYCAIITPYLWEVHVLLYIEPHNPV